MGTEIKNYELSGGVQKTSLALIAIGIVAMIASFVINPTVGWVDFLVNTIYFVLVALSGIFFLAVTGVMQASWITPYKRIPEAMTKFLPIGFVFMLATYFGLHTIYEWTHTEVVINDPILKEKTPYLNETFYMIRMVVIFVIWILLGKKLLSLSKDQDANPEKDLQHSIMKTSAIGLILFGLTISFAAFDWIMSVEPHWFSTIFGVYIFAGMFVTGISFTTLSVIKLREWGYMQGIISDDHLHDLGKWMFGISVFWAYIWISQYLLIWYANIPEETEYYVMRHHHWNGIFFFNLAINFLAPFVLLMSRGAKRSAARLKLVACILMVGHFIDLYLMVAPKVFEHHNTSVVGFGIIQFLSWLGFFGLFILVVAKSLSKMNLIPKGDPNLDEGLHLHQ